MRISVENVSFAYPLHPVLSQVSFSVADAEILSILGPNGSGKSTLLRLIARILLPAEGMILLNEQPLNSYKRRDLARQIAYVPQEVPWLFPFTVMEVVLMGRSPYLGRLGFENERDLAVCRNAMELTDITHLAQNPITEISGGERQRVLIARALAQEPSLLLLDEPNAHLDLSHQAGILGILRRLNQERGLTILSVSHDLNLASGFSDRVLVLGEQGPTGTGARVLALGSPEGVLTRELIQRVFEVPVTVEPGPETGRPRVFLDTALIMNKDKR